MTMSVPGMRAKILFATLALLQLVGSVRAMIAHLSED